MRRNIKYLFFKSIINVHAVYNIKVKESDVLSAKLHIIILRNRFYIFKCNKTTISFLLKCKTNAYTLLFQNVVTTLRVTVIILIFVD